MPSAAATDHSQRFAKKSTEASISYAHAGAFAGMAVFDAVFDAWSDACKEAMTPLSSRSKSWFRAPEKTNVLDPFSFWTTPITAWSDYMSGQFRGQNGRTPASFFDLWMQTDSTAAPAWAAFLPTVPNTIDLSFTRMPFWTTATAALPMTWALMSFGVPYAIAKPTAEGNAAALEAFDSAQQFTNEQIEAYQTALEPVSRDATSEPAPDPLDVFTELFWPWLSVPSQNGSPKAA